MIVCTRHAHNKANYAGACDSSVVRHKHDLTVFLTDHTGAATGEIHLVSEEARELWERLGTALGEREAEEAPPVLGPHYWR